MILDRLLTQRLARACPPIGFGRGSLSDSRFSGLHPNIFSKNSEMLDVAILPE